MNENKIVSLMISSVKGGIPHPVKKGIAAMIPNRIKKRIYFHRSLKESDVFLIGHPKSGNTWLACMLAILVNNDREKGVNISNIGEFVPTIHNYDLSISNYTELSPPRIFRNEAPVYPAAYPKTIYILRDPRAVLLSYYHHCVHDTGKTDWPISDFVDEMLTTGCIKSLEPHLIRWDIQVESWMERAKRQPVFFAKYEDLKHDCHSVLHQLSSFIGLDLDADLIDIAVERNSFSRMREDEKKFGAESFPGEKGARGFFVRKGKIDSWKEEMSVEVVEKIEKKFHPVMKKMGYIN